MHDTDHTTTEQRSSVAHVVETKGITDAHEWTTFVTSFTNETFHHSWEWGEVYAHQGHNIHRCGMYIDHNLICVALVIKITAKRGSFLLIPHGPVFNQTSTLKTKTTILSALTNYLKRIGIQEHCSFIRVAPILPRTDDNFNLFTQTGYRPAPIFVQSEQSWVLDISVGLEEVIKGMRKSTRYIIKHESDYNLSYTRSTDTSAFNDFYQLYKNTVDSQGFFGQSEKFIRTEFETFAASNSAAIYSATLRGEALASAIIIEYNNTGYYHYGASKRVDGQYIPAPHLLQWFIVKSLHSKGFTHYNFWGVSPKDKPNHPWAGLSNFKRGFGGEEHEYVKTMDFVLSPRYQLNWVVEKIRARRRGY